MTIEPKINQKTVELAKQAGFTEFTSKSLSGPFNECTQAYLSTWLRNTFGIYVGAISSYLIYDRPCMFWRYSVTSEINITEISTIYNNYEMCIEGGLQYALQLIIKSHNK